MFSFRETYFRLVDLFDWEYARTQFLLSVSQNRYGFALAGYRNEKSATDPALVIADPNVGEQHVERNMLSTVLLKILAIYSFNNLAKIKKIALTYIVHYCNRAQNNIF